MSEPIIWVRTCEACGHDNPENAKRCNSCAKDLTDKLGRNLLCIVGTLLMTAQ